MRCTIRARSKDTLLQSIRDLHDATCACILPATVLLHLNVSLYNAYACACTNLHACVCVRACVRALLRARVRMIRICVCVRACVCVCACVCVGGCGSRSAEHQIFATPGHMRESGHAFTKVFYLVALFSGCTFCLCGVFVCLCGKNCRRSDTIGGFIHMLYVCTHTHARARAHTHTHTHTHTHPCD